MMKDIEEAKAEEVQSQIEKADGDEVHVDFSHASENLIEGFLSMFETPLGRVKKDLEVLTTRQDELLVQVQSENNRLLETFEDIPLHEMFETIKLYQGKLSMFKKEMAIIQERMSKLKKRTLRLQEIKQKEALNREERREQEMRREQELIGKPVIS